MAKGSVLDDEDMPAAEGRNEGQEDELEHRGLVSAGLANSLGCSAAEVRGRHTPRDRPYPSILACQPAASRSYPPSGSAACQRS
jgi:hypothetical protein